MTTYFPDAAIIERVIKAVDAGANVADVIDAIESYAASAHISLACLPDRKVVIAGHTYCAYKMWTQALHAGFKYHAARINVLGLSGLSFSDYAHLEEAKFGVSVFVIDADLPVNDDESTIAECFDMTTHRDNAQRSWRDWVQGPSSYEESVAVWIEDVDGDGVAQYSLDCFI